MKEGNEGFLKRIVCCLVLVSKLDGREEQKMMIALSKHELESASSPVIQRDESKMDPVKIQLD